MTDIVPRYKLMLFYDLKPQHADDYYEFIMNEMIDGPEDGLYMFGCFTRSTATARCGRLSLSPRTWTPSPGDG